MKQREEVLSVIEHQKEVTDEVIIKLQNYFGQAVCAGGAPRDWYFSTAANDIDIYVKSNIEIEDMNSLLGGVFDVNVDDLYVSKYKEEVTEDGTPCLLRLKSVNSIHEFTYNDVKIQIIGMSSCLEFPLEKIHHYFDLSICEIRYIPFARSCSIHEQYNFGDSFILGEFYKHIYFTNYSYNKFIRGYSKKTVKRIIETSKHIGKVVKRFPDYLFLTEDVGCIRSDLLADIFRLYKSDL